jgi:hypothetical protein
MTKIIVAQIRGIQSTWIIDEVIQKAIKNANLVIKITKVKLK